MPVNRDLSQLWVCWKKPGAPPSGDTPVLSFLSPASEEEFERERQGVMIHAREASAVIRSEAREVYLNLVARIGIAPCRNGLTLRRALARQGRASWWWYHYVALKSCELDPMFEWIIAVLTIRAVAEKHRMNKLVFIGAPWEVVAVLKSVFVVEERDTQQPKRKWWIRLRDLGSRAKYAATMMWQWIAIRRHTQLPVGPFDVVFSSFWDWSVSWDERAQSLSDQYFKRLPEELKWRGVSFTGWFAWFDPHSGPGNENRRLEDALAPLNGRENVVILQSLLHPWDILRALGDFHPLATFLRVYKRSAFKEVFQENGLDYYPLFSERLLRGFLDASLPRCELVALATERACRRYRPEVALSFLEHFPYSRAHYEGVRRAENGTICCAVQHASYNHEKTFFFLHPSLEFKGEPDGCAVPHPDYVCAMGILGQELFLECGYPKKRVLLTGSPRYDHISVSFPEPLPRSQGRLLKGSEGISLLMVSTLNLNLEMEMLEAVCAAARDVTGVKLMFRNHPFNKIEKHGCFDTYKAQVEITQGSLDEDLNQADLIFFTYSTVAEEAFLRGKPVWQWLPLGFNGSALAEVETIPQFRSVVSLRRALRDFQADPSRFLPEMETRQGVVERLFFRGDGGAAKRIANVIVKLPSCVAEEAKVKNPTVVVRQA